MKTIKVSETTPIQLDWLVAKCEGVCLTQAPLVRMIELYGHIRKMHGGCYSPTSNWAQGGPIIEREKIDLEGLWNVRGCGVRTGFQKWCATHPKNHGGLIRYTGYGQTSLTAAMRCFVASKLGDEVEIPEELA